MVVTNYANPTTANGYAYFFPVATSTTGTTTEQKIPATAICMKKFSIYLSLLRERCFGIKCWSYYNSKYFEVN